MTSQTDGHSSLIFFSNLCITRDFILGLSLIIDINIDKSVLCYMLQSVLRPQNPPGLCPWTSLEDLRLPHPCAHSTSKPWLYTTATQ